MAFDDVADFDMDSQISIFFKLQPGGSNDVCQIASDRTTKRNDYFVTAPSFYAIPYVACAGR
jgi:hypothetical protein